MTNFNYLKPGLANVGSYQVSGIPWLTSSLAPSSGEIQELYFPKVTKFINVKNNDSSGTVLRIGFDRRQMFYSTGEYITLSSKEAVTLDTRSVNLYLMSDNSTNVSFSVAAGLTSIDRSEYPLILQQNGIFLASEQNFSLITENEDYIVLE